MGFRFKIDPASPTRVREASTEKLLAGNFFRPTTRVLEGGRPENARRRTGSLQHGACVPLVTLEIVGSERGLPTYFSDGVPRVR